MPMDYLDVLTRLHEALRPHAYLEIGVFGGESLRLAREARVCVGVDPEPRLGADDPLAAHVEVATSDAFFAGPRPRELFGAEVVDLVFIDGMHLFEFALRDFINAEALAGPGSVIVMHDSLPRDAATASRERTSDDWTGDVWKLVLCLLDHRPELVLELIDVAPSGLLVVTGLAPDDETLRRGYDALVGQYAPLGFDVWEGRRDEVARRTGLALHTSFWRGLERHIELRRQTDDEVGRLRTELERARTELAVQRRMLADVHASTSWRVSAPVRAAGRRLERLSAEGGAGAAGAPVRAAARRLRGRRGAAVPGVPAEEEAVGLGQDPLLLAAAARRLSRRPLISVLMPVYETDPACLKAAVDSVLAQAYTEWELCVCDDGSARPETLAVLDGLPAKDARIHVLRHEANRGIAAATNTALAAASGEFVACLDHDDLLLPGALLSVAAVLDRDPAVDAVYTDQASVDAGGGSPEPFLKPDWSPDLFRGVMYVGHLLAVRTELVRAVGGVDPAYDNVQDFELMLRIAEAAGRIAHVPSVQYLWRKVAGSVASSPSAKGGIERLQAAAVNAHLARCGVPGEAMPYPGIPHRVIVSPRFGDRAGHASVVVVATGAGDALEDCVRSVRESGSARLLELIVAGGAPSAAAREQIAAAGGRLLAVAGSDAAAMSAGAAAAGGDVVVFVRGDLRVTTAEWLEHFLLGCHAPDVACVAPVVVAGGRVVSAGLVLDPREGPLPAMAGWEAGGDGRAGSLSCVREVAAVSGSCFSVRRAVLEELGGFDAYLGSADTLGTDLSLRAFARGLRNLCSPRVVVEEGAGRAGHGDARELDRLLLLDAWEPVWRRGDPYWPEARPRGASGDLA